MDIVHKERTGGFDFAKQNLKDDTGKAFDALVVNALVTKDDSDTFQKNISSYIDDGYGKAREAFQKAFNEYAKSQTRGGNEMFSILALINEGTTAIKEVQRQISVDLDGPVTIGRAALLRSGTADKKVIESVAAVDEAKAKNKATTRSIIGDQGLHNDPLASAVVFAPEEFWRRQEWPQGINRTEAFGGFGNTDIAIKMQSIGSFTIKGVRLDASKITQATFAVGRQAIKTIAAIYGVPLPVGSGPATTPATANPDNLYPERSIGFASPEGRKAEAEREALRLRLARINLMETIILQKAALEDAGTGDGPKAARNAAVIAIKGAFTARRTDLDPPPPTK